MYIPQIQALANVLGTRLLPTFENLKEEADVIEKKHWEDSSSLPGDENVDMAALAESAFDAGLTHYLMMTGLRQGIINMVATAIYHLFEQQMMEFHKRGILEMHEEKDASLHKLNIAWARLENYGIFVKSLSCWPIMEELRLVANTVKHAEGASAKDLHSIRPELFVAPEIREIVGISGTLSISAPLFGDGLYISEVDVAKYKEAIVSFWNTLDELANQQYLGSE